MKRIKITAKPKDPMKQHRTMMNRTIRFISTWHGHTSFKAI